MILLLDNYDSFTYNIAHALGSRGQEVRVFRSDAITTEDVASIEPAAIVISPGPGRPEGAGISCQLIERLAGKIPILGVCLGHQCIAQVFGARVDRAENLVHGKTSEIFHDGRTIYSGVRNPFRATRYHSLIALEETISPPLEVSAYTMDGEIMGLRCKDMKVEGVQFHPESIATPQGGMIFQNFLDKYLDLRVAA
jgi:anthranilate synthase/aminodeoxychorismate synthase-like glutamine amidotransferase